jgi:hypothetical protein
MSIDLSGSLPVYIPKLIFCLITHKLSIFSQIRVRFYLILTARQVRRLYTIITPANTNSQTKEQENRQ